MHVDEIAIGNSNKRRLDKENSEEWKTQTSRKKISHVSQISQKIMLNQNQKTRKYPPSILSPNDIGAIY